MKERISIFLISVAIIGFQLAIISLLSYSQWHHFAYLAVSIAMLGFGSSGVILAIWRSYFGSRVQVLLPFLFVTTGISMFIAPILINSEWLRFDTLLIFSSFNHLLKLCATCIILFVPFLTGALAIGLFFTCYKQQINKLYAFNLAGSALGGIIFIWLSNKLLPMHLASVFGFTALLGAPLIGLRKINLIHLTIALLIGVLVLWIQPGVPFTSQYKSLSKTLLIPGTKVLKQIPLSQGTLELIISNNIRQASGLSLNYTRSVPVVDMAFLNAQPYFALEKTEADSSFYKMNVYALPYLLNDNQGQEVLLVQPNGTFYISQANIFGYSPTVIEPIEFIADTIANHLWSYGEVDVINNYPRQTLHQGSMKIWDLIMFPPVGNTGSSGLNALNEDYLFTTNSLANSITLLGDSGILVLSSVMDNPARSNLKLISLASETLRTLSLNPKEHLLSIRTWNTLLVMIKKTPFASSELSRTTKFCNDLGFDYVYPDKKSHYNILTDSDFHLTALKLIDEPNNTAKQNYKFNLHPSTDNSPYFSQFMILSRFKDYIRDFGIESVVYLELGYFIVWVSFIVCFIISLIGIIFPALTRIKRKKTAYWVYFYFSLIGLAYMLLEVSLIQKSILTLNNPVTASAIVISSLLSFSAIGSFVSSYKFDRIPYVLLFIGIYIGSYTLIGDYIAVWLAKFNEPIRIASVVISTAPLAVFMGMVFPLGMRKLVDKYPGQIPIAWGVNGFFSVIAAPLATITAVEFGFNQVLLSCAIFYLLCIPIVLKANIIH